MNYDQWRTMAPDDDEQPTCHFCGDPCKDTYCNDKCKREDLK
jgi:hypothetical protein